MRYQIGRVLFSLIGEGPVADRVREEFGAVRQDRAQNREDDLTFHFVDRLPTPADCRMAPPLLAGPTFISSRSKTFSHLYTREGGRHEVFVQTRPLAGARRYLPDVFARLRDRSHLSPYELVAKNIVYECFDYVFQQVQLGCQQSFVHASSMARDGRAVCFMAWGGVGKTTSLLKFMHEEGYRFLSDDLGILTADGEVLRNPKRMQVYGYNMEGEPWLRDAVLSGRRSSDLLAWRYRRWRKGPKGVRRRVSAEDLFGPAAAAGSSRLETAIYLERTDGRGFRLEKISPATAASKAAAVLFAELDPYSTLASYYRSCFPEGDLLYSHAEMFENSRSIIRSALEHARGVYSLHLPEKATPTELYRFLRKNLLTETQGGAA